MWAIIRVMVMMIKMKTIMIIRIMMVMVMDHDGDSDDHHMKTIMIIRINGVGDHLLCLLPASRLLFHPQVIFMIHGMIIIDDQLFPFHPDVIFIIPPTVNCLVIQS